MYIATIRLNDEQEKEKSKTKEKGERKFMTQEQGAMQWQRQDFEKMLETFMEQKQQNTLRRITLAPYHGCATIFNNIMDVFDKVIDQDGLLEL